MSESVRRRPYCVVLFDEIEKAHHDVFNVLLQVLDDGRLTDGQGRTVDFTNTIIIMTSNIGSPIIQEFYSSKDWDTKELREMEQLVQAELKSHFRPEFLNRLDDIIIFHSLSQEQIHSIVQVQLDRLDRRLAQQNLHLELDAAAKDILGREGFDPQFGARPLKRAVQELILDPLSVRLLEGEFKSGDMINATGKSGEISFRKK